MATSAGVLWLGWRHLIRSFRPANGELAVLQGLQLIRGARRVLAVTAHADDLEAVAGGTLRLMALAGSRIDVAVLSDGQQQNNRRSNLAQIRAMEERHAGLILGYRKLHFLGFRDLALSRVERLECRLRQVWESVRPDVVFSFDPSFPEPYLLHPDHLTAGRIVLNLSRRALGQVASVYFYGTRDTNVVVNVTPVIEDKVQAVLAHRSQLQTHPALYSLLIRLYGRLRGRAMQLQYAEGFRALSLPDLAAHSLHGQWNQKG
jgi:LmbE family N-acetylglucosaminyl deacetylase